MDRRPVIVTMVPVLGSSYTPIIPLLYGAGLTQDICRSGDYFHNWVAVKEHKLSYHNEETLSFTIYTYYDK